MELKAQGSKEPLGDFVSSKLHLGNWLFMQRTHADQVLNFLGPSWILTKRLSPEVLCQWCISNTPREFSQDHKLAPALTWIITSNRWGNRCVDIFKSFSGDSCERHCQNSQAWLGNPNILASNYIFQPAFYVYLSSSGLIDSNYEVTPTRMLSSFSSEFHDLTDGNEWH